MKRLCVIGNSHVGSLKEGYDLLDDKFFMASFWSIPGSGPRIKIENNKIIASQNKLERRVVTDIQPHPGKELDISSYDAILLSGVGIPAIRKQNATINSKYLAAGFIDSEIPIDRQVLSRELFSRIIKNSLQNLSSFQNISKIESIFNKEIYIQLFPMPTPGVVKQADFDAHYYGRNLGSFLSWYYLQQRLVIEEHIRNKNISLVLYPDDWVKTGFTPIEYHRRDSWHMNEKFGEFFMGHLMRQQGF